jgi:hypothetical protein
MSQHERSNGPESNDALDWSGRSWPVDFDPLDKGLAADLHTLFPIDKGVYPPRYAQALFPLTQPAGDEPTHDEPAPLDELTLEDERVTQALLAAALLDDTTLDDSVNNPLYRAPSDRDIQRSIYAVRRRAGLPARPLLPRQWAPSAWADQVTVGSVTGALKQAGRPLATVVTLLVVFMLGSVLFASPSFAQGLRLLLGETGVQQVARYPGNVAPQRRVSTAKDDDGVMPTFWLGSSQGDYVYQGMRTLDQQQYSRGPIIDVQYVLSERNAHQTGSGVLDIREFQISNSLSAVLQSVQTGSISYTAVNGLPAVYVDGMWVTTQGQRTVWQNGTRSMLIFERDGVIFWIVGDQRDGLGQAQLTALASHMSAASMNTLVQSKLLSVRLVGAQLSASLRDPIGYNTELLTLIPRNVSPDTAAGEFVSQGQSPQPPSN